MSVGNLVLAAVAVVLAVVLTAVAVSFLPLIIHAIHLFPTR